MEECTNNAEEEKLAEITSTENENRRKYSSCTLYIALFSMIFTINVGIGTYFVYYKYKNRNKETRAKKGFNYQMTLYYWTYKWVKSQT